MDLSVVRGLVPPLPPPPLSLGEVVCAAFIKAFETNLTLKKPIWRLDHPLAHTLARLVTRNTSIARCASQGKGFENLLPDALKGTGVVVGGAPAAGP